MVQQIPKRSDYRNRLDAAATDLTLFIRDLCPAARLNISFARYEEEDAHIWISLPASLACGAREEIANRVAEKSLDILLAEGLLILAGVEEPDEPRPAPSGSTAHVDRTP